MPKTKKRGPKPDRVKIEGDWQKAVKKALDKKPEPKEPDDDEKAKPEHRCAHCGERLLRDNHSCPGCGRILRS